MAGPVLNNTINQSFFIESLNGADNATTFLSNFPDTVYTKSIDSHLYMLMYAMMGISGAGLLKQQFFQERLQTEAGNITGAALDALYTNPFGFQRLVNESYIWDSEAQLLSLSDRSNVLSADASFRNRARLWMQAIRGGGSALGLSSAASSGLGQQVEAIPNYPALFDQYTDAPIGITYMGSTTNPDEIILVPRNAVPKSRVQSISFPTLATGGQFTIIVPIGPPYVSVTMTTTASNPLPVVNSSLFTVGGWVSINGTVLTCIAIQGPTSILLSGTPPAYTGNILIGKTQTHPIPYNATANDVREAIAALPTIGGLQNVVCTGGPLPYSPVNVIFTGALANTPIGDLIINSSESVITGSTGIVPSDASPMVDSTTVGTQADGLGMEFAESDLELMFKAVDIIRPQTSLLSITGGQSMYLRQPANSYYADQTYTDVIQYVTGTLAIDWPLTDTVNWIEANIEHEMPTLSNDFGGQYTNFHNILGAIAYNERALNDANYNTPLEATIQPFYIPYFDTHVGQFNQPQQLLYPMLSKYTDTSYIFNASYAIAPQPNQPQITAVTSELTALINGSYPSSYLNLPGVNYQSSGSGSFWASDERVSGTDYLEIDLGAIQPVNMIYLEATNKPYSIDVAYECLDQINQRAFVSAEFSSALPSTTALSFAASNTNPWTTVYLPITNPLGGMIYTRYVRIGFTRTSQGQPFQIGTNLVPYSIEVRNLRVGRVVNSYGVSFSSTV